MSDKYTTIFMRVKGDTTEFERKIMLAAIECGVEFDNLEDGDLISRIEGGEDA